MEWPKKDFGCLWKNVGQHFPSLLHGLYDKKKIQNENAKLWANP